MIVFGVCVCVRACVCVPLGVHSWPVLLHRFNWSGCFQVPSNASTSMDAFSAAPTVLWWVPPSWQDMALTGVAYTGLVLATVLLVMGSANAIIFAALWALYHSIVAVGQRW